MGTVAGPAERGFLERQTSSRVVLEPWMEPLEVNRRLAGADIGLVLLHDVPRYREALPVKLFEYMAAGLPVIASDFPLWKGILEESDAGLVVDARDPEAIAEAMDRLIRSPELRQVMGENARLAVLQKYNWQSEANVLLKLYEEVLSRERA